MSRERVFSVVVHSRYEIVCSWGASVRPQPHACLLLPSSIANFCLSLGSSNRTNDRGGARQWPDKERYSTGDGTVQILLYESHEAHKNIEWNIIQSWLMRSVFVKNGQRAPDGNLHDFTY